MRNEQVTTPGLYPAGTRITTWAVDLGGRTLLADAVELPRGDHERAVAALDAMVESLRTKVPVSEKRVMTAIVEARRRLGG